MAARFVALALATLAAPVPSQGVVFSVELFLPGAAPSGKACVQLPLAGLYHMNGVTLTYVCPGCNDQDTETFNGEMDGGYSSSGAAFSRTANATIPTSFEPTPTLPYPGPGQAGMGVCVTGSQRPVNLTLQFAATPAEVPLPCDNVDGIAGAQSRCLQRDGPNAIPICGVKKYGCTDGCIGSFNTSLPVETKVFAAQNHILPYLPYSVGIHPISMNRLYNLTQAVVSAACLGTMKPDLHRLRDYIFNAYNGSPLITSAITVADGATVIAPLASSVPFPKRGRNQILLSIGSITGWNCTVQVNTSFIGTTVEIPGV